MKLLDAIEKCPVRGAIYREGDKYKTYTEDDVQACHPSLQSINRRLYLGKKVRKLYWKNHPTPMIERFSTLEYYWNDWQIYDPREDDNCSLAAFND